jgi:hypothetical protein
MTILAKIKMAALAYLMTGALLGGVTDHMYHKACPADPHLSIMNYVTAAELWPAALIAVALNNRPSRGCLVGGIEE